MVVMVVMEEEHVSPKGIAAPAIETTVVKPEATAIETTVVKPEATAIETTVVKPETTVVKPEATTAPACSMC